MMRPATQAQSWKVTRAIQQHVGWRRDDEVAMVLAHRLGLLAA